MKQIGTERKPYYYGMGENVSEAKSVDDIMRMAKLDWEVEKQPIFLGNNNEIPNRFATVRKDTGKVMGIVGNTYEVVQNRDGFAFVEQCLGEGITFTKAGLYNRGERIFMIGEAPSVEVMGDEVHPTILFMNSHDGSGSIKAMFTPMRLVCENGLMIPIAGHEKGIVNFKIPHTKRVQDRLWITQDLIKQNNQYIDVLKQRAELLAATPFTKEQFKELSLELAGVEEGVKITRGQEQIIADLSLAYEEDDVANFNGTAWGAMLAVSDYDTHKLNSRNTGNMEYGFERMAYGMAVVVAASQIIARMTGVGLRR